MDIELYAHRMWDKIIYLLPNFNGCNWGIDKQFHPTLYDVRNYLSMLGLQFHVSKRSPCGFMWYVIAYQLPDVNGSFK